MAPPPAPLVAVVGPTASGKSALALRLARARAGEIVSCDSLQVYRGLDIGSAKATAEERVEVPHHLVDALNELLYAELLAVKRTLGADHESAIVRELRPPR